MSKLITDAQKHEIEELSVEHLDALLAYGADMYRDGLIKGAVCAGISVILGIAISRCVELLKKHKERTDSKEVETHL